MIPVGSVLTTPMLDVRPTTAEAVTLSTTTRGATMSLISVEQLHVSIDIIYVCDDVCAIYTALSNRSSKAK